MYCNFKLVEAGNYWGKYQCTQCGVEVILDAEDEIDFIYYQKHLCKSSKIEG